LNRDRSYYRRQRMRVIHRKENILRQLGGEENVLAWEHGAAGRLSKGKIHCGRVKIFSHFSLQALA